jgi:hypothetical protein
MPFILETGAGIANANGYVSEAQFREYHNDRNRDLTILTEGQIKAAIIKASEYIDKRFGKRFVGFRQSSSQGLEWPRLDAYDKDGYALNLLPMQLVKATHEYAFRAHHLTILAPDPALPFSTRDTATATGTVVSAGHVIKKREKVGPIETESEFAQVGGEASRSSFGSTLVDGLFLPSYPEADMWLEELLVSYNDRDVLRG